MLKLGIRRLGMHRTALITLIATAVVSFLVLAVLRLFSGAVADAAAATSFRSAASGASTIAISGATSPDRWPGQRALVARAVEAIPGASLSEVIEPTPMGLVAPADADGDGDGDGDRPAEDAAGGERAVLSAIPDLDRWATLVEGEWPGGATARDAPVPAVVSETAAAAADWRIGQRMTLYGLTPTQPERADIVIAGIFTVTDPQASIWLDVPLALTGVSQDDFTRYGPLVVDEADFARVANSGPGRWRISVPGQGLTEQVAAERGGQVTRALNLLDEERRDAGLQVQSRAIHTLSEARDSAQRTSVALLTPALLLMLLGGVALAMAGAQLAGLRAEETELLRARGWSGVLVSLLALVDIVLVVGIGLAVAAGTGPLLARPLIDATGLDAAATEYAAAATSPDLWGVLGPAAAGVVAILLVIAARTGRLRSAAPGRRGAVLARYGAAGLDVVLIVIGVLGVVQLRRYDASSPRGDPLTLAAPAFVIAGLAVLGLRLLPLLAMLAGRAAGRSRGLTLPWGAWQVARRLRGQAGPVLLVFLAIAMGALALAQTATLDRLLIDQSRIAAATPLRVPLSPDRFDDPDLTDTLADVAGASDRSMAVHRENVSVGDVSGIELLAVDAAAPEALLGGDARFEALRGWVAGLHQEAPSRGQEIPPGAGALRVGFAVRGENRVGEQARAILDAIVELPDGRRLPLDLGSLPLTEPGEASVALPAGLPSGSRVIGISTGVATDPGTADWQRATAQPTDPQVLTDLRMTLTGVWADSEQLDLRDVTVDLIGNVLFHALPGPDGTVASEPLPVIATEQVALAARSGVGDSWALRLAAGAREVRIVGIVDAIPGAADPRRAVLADLGALAGALQAPTGEAPGSLAIPATQEWWLAPEDPAAAAAALRERGISEQPTTSAQVVDDRRADATNSGMRAALRLVTVSALALAALGFAVATAALAGARRRDGAILLALGMPPGQIRRAVAGERLVVLLLAGLIGTGIGLIATRSVVPLLVGADGGAAFVAVVIDYAPTALATFTGLVLALLGVVSVLVVRGTTRDVAASLREGERS